MRLLYADAGGAAFSSDGAETDLSDRQYFRDSLAGARVIERVERGRVSEEPKMIMSVPVTRDGETVGVVVGSFNEADFREAVLQDERGGSLICMSDGEVVLSSGGEGVLAPKGGNVLAMLRQVRLTHTNSRAGVAADVASGQGGVLAYEYEGRQLYAAYEPLGINDWMVFCALDGEAVMAPARALSAGGYVQTIVVTAVALILFYYVVFTQRRYRQQLDIYRSMDQGGVFSIVLDDDLTLVYANDKFYQMLGCDKEAMREKFDNRCIRCVLSADVEGVLSTLRTVRESGGGYASLVMRVSVGEGGVKYFLMSGVAERGVFSGVAVDITEQKRGEAELSAMYRRELSYRKAMEPNFYSTALYNITRRTLVDSRSRDLDEEERSNRTLEEFARAAAASVQEDDEDVRHYFDTLTTQSLERRAERTDEPVSFDFLMTRPDGALRWMHYEAHLLREPESGDLMAFLYLTDIHEAKSMVRELEEAARTDSMTGLLNHDAALGDIRRYLSMEGAGGFHALYMIDLDNLKLVNDTLGHQRGDAILRDVAEALRRSFRATDVIGRVGGDEFMVLMKNVPSAAGIRRKAQDLLDSLQFSCPDERGGEPVEVTCSLGAAIFREGGKSFDQLYSEADAALYRAKNAGRSRYAMSEPDLPEAESPEGSAALPGEQQPDEACPEAPEALSTI